MKHIKILFLITLYCTANPFWAQYGNDQLEDAKEELKSIKNDTVQEILERLLEREIHKMKPNKIKKPVNQ